MLTITNFSIVSVSGANKQPVSGDVSFSDGKHWSWALKVEYVDGSYQRTDGIQFWTSRQIQATIQRMMVKSKKREKLVQEYLSRDDLPPVTVFHVNLDP